MYIRDEVSIWMWMQEVLDVKQDSFSDGWGGGAVQSNDFMPSELLKD